MSIILSEADPSQYTIRFSWDFETDLGLPYARKEKKPWINLEECASKKEEGLSLKQICEKYNIFIPNEKLLPALERLKKKAA